MIPPHGLHELKSVTDVFLFQGAPRGVPGAAPGCRTVIQAR
jgi:hypothetical protein